MYKVYILEKLYDYILTSCTKQFNNDLYCWLNPRKENDQPNPQK